jgi:hypothetical protein
MNKKLYVTIVLFFLSVFAVSSIIVRGASQVELTPTSGEPSSTVGVEGTELAASKAVGIGLGAEVAVINEAVTITGSGNGPFTGFAANHPIKPGSFRWTFYVGAVLSRVYDKGDGTLGSDAGFMGASEINYTSGFFSRRTTGLGETPTDDMINYTTYEFDVTPDGLRTDSSGMLSGNFTVPDDIWNGTHTVTVIDEAGNKATADFTVVGSDFIPEPLTVGAVVLLTSTAIFVSFYWMRKRNYKKA